MSVRACLMTLMTLVVALGASDASAHKRFARKFGVECSECHESAEGGGPRNLIGQYYQATQELPVDRSPQTMKLVESTVDRWMLELLSKPPTIRWRRTALDDLEPMPARTLTPAADFEVLRRLSLDLRGTSPTEAEVVALERGQRTVDDFVDEFLASKDFVSTFFLYHKDLVRPRTGLFGTSISFSRITAVNSVYSSDRIRDERTSGDCDSSKVVSVSPWWDRKNSVKVCARSAKADVTVTVRGKTLRCDTDEGQTSGACGCGKNLVHCYIDGIREETINSMRNEMAMFAMEVVSKELPYSDVLTADWTMLDGRLDVFYHKLWGGQSSIEDPDASTPWHRVERDPRHSGVLTSPAMLNFFYNGRRWAQRTFEAFMCHEVTPDFDLLDDAIDAGHTIAVPYRDSPDLMPSQNVTEGRACAACHLQLDAVSRVKDRWDYFGHYYESMPTERHLPIPQEAIFEGQIVDGIDGLGKALAGSETFHDCVVNQAWEHMTGHRFRADETPVRRALVADFRAHNLNFKSLIKRIATTPEYRSTENLKLMKREQYLRAMGRATDVAWKLGKKSGWDIYYDKIGGMDYRKIEFRDVRPGLGHSLVQFKGAAESCSIMVDREAKRDRNARLWLTTVDDVDDNADGDTVDATMAVLYARALGRPWANVPNDERKILRDLFAKVQKKNGAADGWRAVCTAVFASSDYALY